MPSTPQPHADRRTRPLARSLVGGLALLVAGALAAPRALALDPYPNAIMARFLECYEAEGNRITSGDRSLLESTATDLAGLLDRREPRIDCMQSKAYVKPCIESVAAMSCGQLAEALAASLATTPPLGPLPPWAESHARTFGEKVRQTQASGPQGDAARSQAVGQAVQQELRQALGTMTETTFCEGAEETLAACAASIQALSCVPVPQAPRPGR